MAHRIIEAGNRLAAFPYRGRQVPGTQLRETAIVRPYLSVTASIGTAC
jgi:hypothetical protein